MGKRTKIIVSAVLAVVVCALLVAGYLTKEKDGDEAPASEASSHIGGPLLDEPPDETWADDEATGYNGFTTRAQLGAAQGSIGVLSIEKIGVSVHVFDSEDDMANMKKGASHYRTTSYWDGNIGFAAHIGNASYSYFERLRELKEGDHIVYETNLGTRTYAVTEIATIDETDWSRLQRTEDNRVTLTTCIDGQPEMRLCVQAKEV